MLTNVLLSISLLKKREGWGGGGTFVNKQQLPLVYVRLREVVHGLRGGALQRQVPVARRGDHVAQLLRGRVGVLHPQVVGRDLSHRGHPHLRGRETRSPAEVSHA